MNTIIKPVVYSVMVLIICVLSGCATQIEQPVLAAPEPSTVKLRAFDKIYLADITVAEKYADSGANQKAIKKIGEVLFSEMQQVFPTLEKVSVGDLGSLAASGNSILLIKPHIRQIKFIGGGARFWTGAMAGSSVVVMEAEFVDLAKGESVAWPEYQRVASAYSGSWSIGAADNRKLSDIARDFANYARYNK